MCTTSITSSNTIIMVVEVMSGRGHAPPHWQVDSAGVMLQGEGAVPKVVRRHYVSGGARTRRGARGALRVLMVATSE